MHGRKGICRTVSGGSYSRLGPHGYQPSAGQGTMLERDGMLPRQLPGTERMFTIQSTEHCRMACCVLASFLRSYSIPIVQFQGHPDRWPLACTLAFPPRLFLLPCLIFLFPRSRNSESVLPISTSAGPVCHSRISPRPRLSAQRPPFKTLGSIWPPFTRRFPPLPTSHIRSAFRRPFPSFDFPFDLPYPVPRSLTYYPLLSRQQCLHGTRRNVSLRPETRSPFPPRCYQASRHYPHHGGPALCWKDSYSPA